MFNIHVILNGAQQGVQLNMGVDGFDLKMK